MDFKKLLKKKRVMALLLTSVCAGLGIALPAEVILPVAEVVTELF